MYQRLLVPIDGSQTATQALNTALQMARESGGQVRLIHVLEEIVQAVPYDSLGAYPGDLIKVMRDSGTQLLQDALTLAKPFGVRVDVELIEAAGERLADVVDQAASNFNADLIVVGTHGRRGLGRVLMGSGAEQIIRHARVPVLVVRAAEAPHA